MGDIPERLHALLIEQGWLTSDRVEYMHSVVTSNCGPLTWALAVECECRGNARFIPATTQRLDNQ